MLETGYRANGECIRRLRAEMMLTQAELATKAGIGLNTLSRIENHEGRPVRLSTIRGLARVFKVSPRELVQ